MRLFADIYAHLGYCVCSANSAFGESIASVVDGIGGSIFFFFHPSFSSHLDEHSVDEHGHARSSIELRLFGPTRIRRTLITGAIKRRRYRRLAKRRCSPFVPAGSAAGSNSPPTGSCAPTERGIIGRRPAKNAQPRQRA